MTTNISEFEVTRRMFRDYTGYSKPLSFSEWNALSSDYKAAVLYCQFYEQITLAWYKLKSVYSVEADGVAEVMQYLQKNVPIIEEQSTRFTSAYIYKVCYNCLYCLCRDPNRYKRAYENECSAYLDHDGEELCLFDLVPDNGDMLFASSRSPSVREEIWAIVNSLGVDAQIVVADLIDDLTDYDDKSARLITQEELRDRNRQLADWEAKKAAGVSAKRPRFSTVVGCKQYSPEQMQSVSAERKEELIAALRVLLADYRDVFDI